MYADAFADSRINYESIMMKSVNGFCFREGHRGTQCSPIKLSAKTTLIMVSS